MSMACEGTDQGVLRDVEDTAPFRSPTQKYCTVFSLAAPAAICKSKEVIFWANLGWRFSGKLWLEDKIAGS